MKALTASLLIAGAAICLPAYAQQDPIVLMTNEVEPISLPVPAASIIVGNSAVADVLVQNKKLLLLTGRGFGSTHVSVLDIDGNELFSNVVLVQENTANRLVVRRAGDNQTYTCAPDCAVGAQPQVQVPTLTISAPTFPPQDPPPAQTRQLRGPQTTEPVPLRPPFAGSAQTAQDAETSSEE